MLNHFKKLGSVGKKAILFCISLCVISFALFTNAEAINFNNISQLYFFGDSLTDSGFNNLWPGLPVGKAPTFTTFGGHTWSQILAHDIKGFPFPVYPGPSVPDIITNNSIYPVPGFVSGTLTGIDYAAAGSTTNSTGFVETWAPSLHQQVAYYLSFYPNQQLDPHTVYFIWSGANDFLTALFSVPSPTQVQLLQIAQTAATNIANEVALLAARGATRIVVMSLPNFGLAPFAVGDPVLSASLKNISFTFNSMLNTALGHVIERFHSVKILYVDVYTFFDRAVQATNAGKPFVVAGVPFLFANATSPACAGVPTAIYCPSSAPTNYVFADTLHPTGLAHQALALQVEQLLREWQ